MFAAWTRRLAGREAPPAAGQMVLPDPGRLERAASTALSREFAAEGLADPITDPLSTDPAVTSALRESPLDAAVDLVNHARYQQEHNGPCTGCTRPENPFEHPPDHPFDPEEHPVVP